MERRMFLSPETIPEDVCAIGLLVDLHGEHKLYFVEVTQEEDVVLDGRIEGNEWLIRQIMEDIRPDLHVMKIHGGGEMGI